MSEKPTTRSSPRSPAPRSTASGGHSSSGPGEKSGARELTRRSLLGLGAVAGVGLVVGAIAVDSRISDNAKGSLSQASTQTLAFASTDLTTARWVTAQTGETESGLLFATPLTASSSGVISDNSGQPVWMAPAGLDLSDLRVQQFAGRPVLTYWSGTRVRGYGEGVGNILDARYQPIATVQAAKGLKADLHEFQLTPQGTALLIAYAARHADLSSVHGPSSGYVLDCHVNEVEIQTGKVLLDWSARQHIPLEETFASTRLQEDGDGTSATRAFDAYHLSSIDFDDENLYVSARNMHSIYCLDRSTGRLKWKLGGKDSGFHIDRDSEFAWQNHFRLRPNGMASLFDNRSRTPDARTRSRALLVNLDQSARTVTFEKKFENGPLLSVDMGSAELLGNGNWLVGWGSQPIITEHSPDGKIVYTATLADSPSDRAFRGTWNGTPVSAPSIEIAHGSGHDMLVDVSWNGATEVRGWRFLSGADPKSLAAQKIVPRSEFETTGTLRRAPYAAAQALGLDGSVLATTSVIRSS